MQHHSASICLTCLAVAKSVAMWAQADLVVHRSCCSSWRPSRRPSFSGGRETTRADCWRKETGTTWHSGCAHLQDTSGQAGAAPPASFGWGSFGGSLQHMTAAQRGILHGKRRFFELLLAAPGGPPACVPPTYFTAASCAEAMAKDREGAIYF